MVGDPGAQRLARRARASASSSLVGRGAGRLGGDRGSRRPRTARPAIRAANSSARSPANTRCVWLSTKPGITQRPAASKRSSAAAPAALDRRDDAVLDHQRRVADQAESALAERRVVGDQRPDAVDDQRAHHTTAAIDARELGGDVEVDVGAVADDLASAEQTTRSTSAAVAANTAASSAVSAVVPASRTPSSPTVTRSASAPASIAPASGQPSERVAVAARRPQQRSRAMAAALAAGEALVELDRARLLERVDHRVRVGAEGERRRPPRSAPAPGRSRRRGRARWSGRGSSRRAAPPSSRDVGLVEVGGVHGGEPLAKRAGALEHLGRAWRRRRRRTPRSRPAARRRARAAGSRARPPRRRRPPPSRGRRPRTLWIAAPIRAPSPPASAPTRSAHASASASAKRRWTSLSGSPIPPCR